jgi:hypothetical protein
MRTSDSCEASDSFCARERVNLIIDQSEASGTTEEIIKSIIARSGRMVNESSDDAILKTILEYFYSNTLDGFIRWLETESEGLERVKDELREDQYLYRAVINNVKNHYKIQLN